MNTSKGKIGMSSRYYDPLQVLKSRVSDRNGVYNSANQILAIPSLSVDYKCEINPDVSVSKMVESVRQYFDENLFSDNERELLIANLESHLESFGTDTIKRVQDRLSIFLNKPEYAQVVAEYEKAILSIKRINQLLKQEFLTAHFMTNIEPTVFISYSHDNEEHKSWVLQLATRLRANGVNVILDRWNLTLGSDLASFMERGLSKSQRVICICSDSYINKANNGKGGAGYEKQIMTSELINDQNTNWIIPLIRNNSGSKKTPTFLAGRFYINFDETNLYEAKYEELLRDLLEEPVLPIPPIGKNPFQTIKDFSQQKFIPSSEKYVSPATKGTVTFDYSNNNGRYFIGQDELAFETCWSSAGDLSIYFYSDSASVRSVAVVKDTSEITKIKDARKYDSSSRVRAVSIGQIAVAQNSNGFYAAIKVVSIKIATTGETFDELTFEYVIQTNGSPDFTDLSYHDPVA